MSFVCGIDYSTRAVDVVLVDENTGHATWHRTELEGADAFDRARGVPTGGALLCDKYAWKGALYTYAYDWDDVLAVGIEDPRGYNAGVLYRIQGAILARIPRDTLVHPLVPSQWRTLCGMRGNASKADIENFANVSRMTKALRPEGNSRVLSLPGDYIDWPSDACDAYCVALATQKLIQIKDAA
jgi:hypothetical protein